MLDRGFGRLRRGRGLGIGDSAENEGLICAKRYSRSDPKRLISVQLQPQCICNNPMEERE